MESREWDQGGSQNNPGELVKEEGINYESTHSVQRHCGGADTPRTGDARAELPVASLPPTTPGRKYDGGKAPINQGLFQYFPRALSEVANVSKYGAEKYKLEYSDINWARVEDGRNRYGDARGRHILGEFIDGPVDPESGQLHAAMAAWNALAYLELILKERNGTK